MFLWKNFFIAVENSLSNMASRSLRPRAFNMLCNLLCTESILVADHDLMGSAKTEEES